MMIIRNQVVSIKLPQRARAQSGDKSKPAAPKKQPEKNVKPPPSDKQPEKDAKSSLSKKQPENKSESVSPNKQEPQKATPERNTKAARGNRRVRPMPMFQGRSISDAILIFPRGSAMSK